MLHPTNIAANKPTPGSSLSITLHPYSHTHYTTSSFYPSSQHYVVRPNPTLHSSSDSLNQQLMASPKASSRASAPAPTSSLLDMRRKQEGRGGAARRNRPPDRRASSRWTTCRSSATTARQASCHVAPPGPRDEEEEDGAHVQEDQADGVVYTPTR